jgi:hypothetical protein
MAHRPHIIIKNRKEKMCILTDVAIPVDRNVIQKEAKETKIQQFIINRQCECGTLNV